MKTRHPLALGLVVLLAAGALFVLWGGKAGAEEPGVLRPGEEHGVQVVGRADHGLHAPTQAEEEHALISAPTEASARVIAATAINAGSLSGRVTMAGKGYKGARLTLRKQGAWDAESGPPASKVMLSGKPAWPGGMLWPSLDWYDQALSDASGRFLLSNLPEGDYNLEVQEGRGKRHLNVMFQLGPGEHRSVGPFAFKEPTPEELKRRAEAQLLPARVHVVVGTDDIEVWAGSDGRISPQKKGVTDEGGAVEFEWDSTKALRIELRNAEGFVLGNTEAYDLFAPGEESFVELPVAAGSLELQLPEGWDLLPGQALQYMASRRGETEARAVVATVLADQPEKRIDGCQVTAKGVVFETVFAGQYHVEALLIDIAEDGKWLPRARRARGKATVHAGRAASCRLK